MEKGYVWEYGVYGIYVCSGCGFAYPMALRPKEATEKQDPVSPPPKESTASQQVQVTIFSHETVEYYTPQKYIEAAREVLQEIDLDPASCDAAQKTIQASTFYTKEDDGLQREWFGTVWINPPYSKTAGKSNQGLWAQYLIEQYQKGNVTEAVLLVKAALGYKWFENLWYEWPVCFARERISFIKADGTSTGQSKQGTAFFYFGPNIDKFKEVFGKFGRVILPEETA